MGEKLKMAHKETFSLNGCNVSVCFYFMLSEVKVTVCL